MLNVMQVRMESRSYKAPWLTFLENPSSYV